MSFQKNREFIAYLDKLKTIATDQEIYQKFKKYNSYYKGDVRPSLINSKKANTVNMYNIIKPIVETKATLALDNMLTTNVKPSSLSQINFSDLKDIETVSEILNDVWDNVKSKNNMVTLHQKIVRDGLIYGLGVAQASWDQTQEDNLGNVTISRISPQDFFPEPNASTIENANYIFVRKYVSKFDLINQYKADPRLLDIISNLTYDEKQQENSDEETDIVATFTNDQDSGQAYIREGSVIPKSDKQNILIWECYLKDDTVFVKTDDDTDQDTQVKKENIFKYPYGRMVVYSGEYILQDTKLDYPFGFPFATFEPTQSDSLVGYGDVQDLMQIQARITENYIKLSTLLSKYKSLLLVSKDSIPPNVIEKDFDIIYTNPGPINPPQLISNQLTNDIALVRQNINDLKQDAYKIARINEIMLNGARPTGVNSGQMVKDLIESPMASIREIQRNFSNFLVNISNKGIKLIQLYYNQPRIMRLSGQRFAQLNVDGTTQEKSLDVFDNEGNSISQIQNDFSITDYELEIQTGSALPQSQQALANTTLQLASQGIFGDINNIDVKELILKTLDYPHYKAIINKIKEEQEMMAQQQQQQPTEFASYLKNINVSLKDILTLVQTLDPQNKAIATATITDTLGITDIVNSSNTAQEQPNFLDF